MRAGRATLVVVGLAAAGASVAFALRPGLAAGAGLAGLLAGVGNGYLPVGVLGGLALMWALVVGLSWSLGDGDRAALPAVEGVETVDTPGDEVDRAVAELSGRRGRAARPVEHREWIRERLRTDAVGTLVRATDCDREAAERRVEAGTWTDDRYAASFVGGPDAPGPRPHQRLLGRLRRESALSVRVRRTVAALVALAGEDRR